MTEPHASGRVQALVGLVSDVVACALLALGWAWWSARAEAAARSVAVVAVGDKQCAPGRQVNDGVRLLVVPRPARLCYVEVTLTNRSGRTVRVVGVQTGLGPAESMTRLVVATDGGSGPPTQGGRTEAVMAEEPESTYTLDVELSPDEAYTTRVGLAFNDHYCNGDTISFQPWPSALVMVGGRRYSVAASTDLTIRPGPDTPEAGPGCSSEE